MSKAIFMQPGDIEKQSFSIIKAEIGERKLDEAEAPIMQRVIHTTADFDYLDTLVFANCAVQKGLEALRAGATIVTDTNMALAGINKAALAKLNCTAVCYMADEDVAAAAEKNSTTRAAASMEKAALLGGPVIFAIGNAPTALMKLCTLMQQKAVSPSLIIGVPVGFVNVVESKEQVLATGVPAIVARGRKGGSNVAAAICNALLYTITRGGEI